MSAFCSKYPKCGCIGIGTKCYDDFRATITADENLPLSTKEALAELVKKGIEKLNSEQSPEESDTTKAP
jgi:hypothetical protein